MTRTVLVSGASSGMGLATALRFARDGDRLALLSRSPDALTRAEHLCRAEGASDVLTLPADVRDAADVDTAMATVVDRFGVPDVVVHTAATMAYGRIEDVPAEDFDAVVTTAIQGTAHVSRAALSVFDGSSGGTLVVINSLLGSVTVPMMGAYSVAKWGQRALVRTLQQEVRDRPGIHVCLVSPGSINTPIYYQAANHLGRGVRPPWPVRSPEHVADVIRGLADRPRQHVSVTVGVTNPFVISGFRLFPFVYDRIVRPLFGLAATTRRESFDVAGAVAAPRPDAERVHGHWPDRTP